MLEVDLGGLWGHVVNWLTIVLTHLAKLHGHVTVCAGGRPDWGCGGHM